MKTLLIVKEKEFSWLGSTFQNCHPLATQICKKPLLEYFIDFSILCGINDIRLATDAPTEELVDQFGQGSRWGISLDYSPVRETDELDEIIQKNSLYCKDSRLLVVKGFCFLHYDKNIDYKYFMHNVEPGELSSCETGSVRVMDDLSQSGTVPASDSPTLSLSPVSNVGDIHRLSMEILMDHSDQYVLPGYNNEDHIYIGHNVTIAKKAKIIPPVMIGNHVQIYGETVVGPGAIIGSDVIIDAHSSVQDSVIFDKTYVGEHLELKNKLLGGNLIVDPDTGTQVHLEDPHLLSQVKSSKKSLPLIHRIFHQITALLAVIIMALPYAAFALILKLQKRWLNEKETVFINSSGRTVELVRVTIKDDGLVGRIARSLSLERFPVLIRVMQGKLALIGSRALPADEENRKVLDEYQAYRPAAFSYAEAESWPAEDSDWEIVERFHLARRSLLRDYLMALKAVLNSFN